MYVENDVEFGTEIGYTAHMANTGDVQIKFDNDEEMLVSDCPSWYDIEVAQETIFEDSNYCTVIGKMHRSDYVTLSKEWDAIQSAFAS